MQQETDPNLASVSAPNLLTNRELELVQYVARGMNNREIALRLNLSEHTVRNYLVRIFHKFGVSCRTALVWAVTHKDPKSNRRRTIAS